MAAAAMTHIFLQLRQQQKQNNLCVQLNNFNCLSCVDTCPTNMLSPMLLLAVTGCMMATVAGEDIGSDTCGQDRKILSSWFIEHGSPSLILPPAPPLMEVMTVNPYDDPSNPPGDPTVPDGFCATKWSEVEVDPDTGYKKYYLGNFSSEAEVAAAGYNITHRGHCGACSGLQDLGVYLSRNLTNPTRICGILGAFSSALEQECLRLLGFSPECASIWTFNIHNTKSDCFEVCLLSWLHGEPNNKPDGSLNDCLQCDEDESGPNFQYFSGRTRRNSGIPSAIYRPPEQIYNMTHCYWYGDL